MRLLCSGNINGNMNSFFYVGRIAKIFAARPDNGVTAYQE